MIVEAHRGDVYDSYVLSLFLSLSLSLSLSFSLSFSLPPPHTQTHTFSQILSHSSLSLSLSHAHTHTLSPPLFFLSLSLSLFLFCSSYVGGSPNEDSRGTARRGLATHVCGASSCPSSCAPSHGLNESRHTHWYESCHTYEDDSCVWCKVLPEFVCSKSRYKWVIHTCDMTPSNDSFICDMTHRSQMRWRVLTRVRVLQVTVRMSHVTHTDDESCHTCEEVISHIWRSHVILPEFVCFRSRNEWGTSHTLMTSHVTHMKKSYYRHEGVMSCCPSSCASDHGTNESRHSRMQRSFYRALLRIISSFADV